MYMRLYNFYVKSLCVARKAGRCNGQAAVVAARLVAHCWACSGAASKYGRLRRRQRTAGGHEAAAAASKDD